MLYYDFLMCELHVCGQMMDGRQDYNVVELPSGRVDATHY